MGLNPGGISKAQTGNHAGWQVVFTSEAAPILGDAAAAGALAGAVGGALAAVGTAAGSALDAVAGALGLTGATDTRTLKSADYLADIEAALQDGLAGGRYSILVEGLDDKDHGWLVQQMRHKRRLTAKLYLFWQDVGGVSGYLANLAGVTDLIGAAGNAEPEGLVAKIVVSSVRRRLGQRRYETEITGLESVFYALRSSRIVTNPSDSVTAVIDKVKAASGIDIKAIEPPPSPKQKDEKASKDAAVPPTQRCSEVLRGIIERWEQAFSGPSQFLIRDGAAVIGQRKVPYRTDPAADAEAFVLTAANGLIEATSEIVDTGELPAEDEPSAKPEQFTLTLKGRYDLKPGELVRFAAPDPDDAGGIGVGAAMLGALAAPLLGGVVEDPKTEMYVSSVLHRLGRTTGFQTILKGVVFKDKNPWKAKPAADKAQGGKTPQGGSADPAIAAALKWKELVQDRIDQVQVMDIAQVWAHSVEARKADGVASLSSTIYEGLGPDDDRAQGVQSLNLLDSKLARPARGIGYLTPFAWGHCGLVLPRYPGSQIAVGYRKGKAHDAVDLGGIWRQDLKPKAEAGDWWLSLPVDAQDKKGGDAKKPADRHSGKVSNDLIDAKGDRLIETSSFVVRVGKSSLNDAGGAQQRPQLGDALSEGVTIEHKASKARISIDKNGNIELSGKTITLKADDVKVQVKNKMNVE